MKRQVRNHWQDCADVIAFLVFVALVVIASAMAIPQPEVGDEDLDRALKACCEEAR